MLETCSRIIDISLYLNEIEMCIEISSKIQGRVLRMVKYASNQKMDTNLGNQLFKVYNFDFIHPEELCTAKAFKI